jgi:hypothetical protein
LSPRRNPAARRRAQIATLELLGRVVARAAVLAEIQRSFVVLSVHQGD